MSERTPIEPNDIKVGDLIRFEVHAALNMKGRAREYVAESDGDRDGYPTTRGEFFFLDRPNPAINIPHVPTLAWLKTVYGRPVLAIWTRGKEGLQGESTAIYRVEADITDFVPATAVPTEALNFLRTNARCQNVKTFLSAIDATGATS